MVPDLDPQAHGFTAVASNPSHKPFGYAAARRIPGCPTAAVCWQDRDWGRRAVQGLAGAAAPAFPAARGDPSSSQIPADGGSLELRGDPHLRRRDVDERCAAFLLLIPCTRRHARGPSADETVPVAEISLS